MIGVREGWGWEEEQKGDAGKNAVKQVTWIRLGLIVEVALKLIKLF